MVDDSQNNKPSGTTGEDIEAEWREPLADPEPHRVDSPTWVPGPYRSPREFKRRDGTKGKSQVILSRCKFCAFEKIQLSHDGKTFGKPGVRPLGARFSDPEPRDPDYDGRRYSDIYGW